MNGRLGFVLIAEFMTPSILSLGSVSRVFNTQFCRDASGLKHASRKLDHLGSNFAQA